MTRPVAFSDNEILYLTDSPSEYQRLLDENKSVIPVLPDYRNQFSSTENELFFQSKYALSEVDLSDETKWNDGLDPAYLYHVYQRLNHIPWHILDTDRMSLRESTIDDVDRFYEIYAKDPDIEKYVENLFENPEDEKLYQKNYISKIYEFYDFGVWTIDYKESKKVIGRAGLSIVDGYDYPDLGFIIDKDMQNRGLAFEICSAILNYAHNTLGFDTIQARVRPENEKSIHLLKKLGFEFDGTIKDEYLIAIDHLCHN